MYQNVLAGLWRVDAHLLTELTVLALFREQKHSQMKSNKGIRRENVLVDFFTNIFSHLFQIMVVKSDKI